jgi:hypothetical protein
MELCSKCDYMYTIRKMENKKKELTNVDELLKNINNLSKFNILISSTDIKKNKKFRKLDKKKQNDILLFLVKNKNIDIEFYCTNCNNTELVNRSIKLYEINRKEKENIVLEPHVIKLYMNNPLYPKTNLYKCKNESCDTHKNNSIKKATFFKQNNNMKYICNICMTYW